MHPTPMHLRPRRLEDGGPRPRHWPQHLSDCVPAAALTAPQGLRIGLSGRCPDRTRAQRHVRSPPTVLETELGRLVTMETAGRQQLLTRCQSAAGPSAVTKICCQGNVQPWLRLSNESQTESKKSDSAEFYRSERLCGDTCYSQVSGQPLILLSFLPPPFLSFKIIFRPRLGHVP